MISGRAKVGVSAGLTVFAALAVPVYVVQSGTLGGTALGLLTLSPVPVFASGAVAGVRTVPGDADSTRAAVRAGVVAGGLVGIVPAVIAARFGYGLAALGDNLLGPGGVLVTGIVAGILVGSGVLGGIGGGLVRGVRRRLSTA